MKIGYKIETPRFLTVRIDEILQQESARVLGYTEATHYENPKFNIFGKVIGENQMVFAAVAKSKPREG